ncbi:PP68 [Orf virus]|uniref:PP68 n=1 Tax=Orf virus TaxID=10258 RepID=F1AX75_ORFV|nr:PP68 [Orf virus]
MRPLSTSRITRTPCSFSRIWNTFLPCTTMSPTSTSFSDMRLMMLLSVSGVFVIGEAESSRKGTRVLFLITIMSSPVLFPKMLCASSTTKTEFSYLQRPL